MIAEILSKGRMLLEVNRPELAIEQARQALALDVENPDAHLLPYPLTGRGQRQLVQFRSIFLDLKGRRRSYVFLPMKSKASAVWQGGLKDGHGTMSTDSGALSAVPFSFKTRFEGEKGTNPEELIGAAHAGCFSMAFSAELGGAGYTPESVETSAAVTLGKDDTGFAVTNVDLVMKAKIPGISEEEFQSIAAKAKAGCPISKLLKAAISLDATLL